MDISVDFFGGDTDPHYFVGLVQYFSCQFAGVLDSFDLLGIIYVNIFLIFFIEYFTMRDSFTVYILTYRQERSLVSEFPLELCVC